MQWIKKISLSLLIVLLIGIFGFSISWYDFLTTPLPVDPTVVTTVIVYPGMQLQTLTKDLQQRGFITQPYYFFLLARYKGFVHKLRMGEYLITPQTTPLQLLDNIVAGKVYMRKMTFVEGWKFEQMKTLLANDPYIIHNIYNKTNRQIMAELGSNKDPEGLFYPDTYLYTWGNQDIKILRQAYQKMQKVLAQQWQQRNLDLPYKNSYQALIVASMVEHETALASEKPLIAGVIVKRLQKGMRLQIDPTVLYGVNKGFGAVITHLDLLDDNPYNTYRHAGLPPTPIGMPSSVSIIAALHPVISDALYYVSQGDGSHFFSATYQAHQAAVTKFRLLSSPSSSH